LICPQPVPESHSLIPNVDTVGHGTLNRTSLCADISNSWGGTGVEVTELKLLNEVELFPSGSTCAREMDKATTIKPDKRRVCRCNGLPIRIAIYLYILEREEK
jgi:hypothetical protein